MKSKRKIVSPNCGFSNFKKCGLFSSQQIIVQYISTLLSGSRFTSCGIYLDVLFICVALFLSSFNAIDFNIEKEKRNQSIPCIFEQSLQQNLCEPLFFFVQCISVFFPKNPMHKRTLHSNVNYSGKDLIYKLQKANVATNKLCTGLYVFCNFVNRIPT